MSTKIKAFVTGRTVIEYILAGVVLVLLFSLLVGSGSLRSDLASEHAARVSAETAVADLEDRNGRLETSLRVVQREVDTLDEREADLNLRSEALDQRSEELDTREGQITQAEEVAAMSEFGDGTRIIGQDVIAGTYRGGGQNCYYAWMSGIDADADIIDNRFGSGPVIVELSDGQVFETSGCGTWTKQP